MNAMNAHRNMSANTITAGKSMEKLSSGLRINRAGDDAAGLAISEKMRGQIRGLDQASRNAQDGISMIQTAEGALNETHSILQRMRELSVQSANDTNVNADRGAIQDEMNQLVSEIDRIANNTEFNTQKLLDGSFSGKFQIGANNTQDMDLAINKMDSKSLGLVSGNTMETGNVVADTLKDGVYKLVGSDLVDVKGNKVATYDNTTGKIATAETTPKDAITLAKANLGEGATITIKDGKFEVNNTLDLKTAAKNLGELAPGKYEIKGTNVIKDGKLVGD